MQAEFEQHEPDVRLEASFGSSGSFFAQLSNEAPFDLFLSADRDFPQRLVDQGQGLDETQFEYAIGRLVLWSRHDLEFPAEIDLRSALTDPRVEKIAIANPEHAPYGRAAVATLKSLGLYDQLSERLVLAENVSQALQFVESGAAELGLVSESLCRSEQVRDRGRAIAIPADAHPPLRQSGVVLRWASDRQAAERFREFLLSAAGRELLRQSGFETPQP